MTLYSWVREVFNRRLVRIIYEIVSTKRRRKKNIYEIKGNGLEISEKKYKIRRSIYQAKEGIV